MVSPFLGSTACTAPHAVTPTTYRLPATSHETFSGLRVRSLASTRTSSAWEARLLLNPSGTFTGNGKRDYMVHTTAVRAQENLVYAASANLVGGPERADFSSSHLDHPRNDDYLGHSVIAGPAFPRFSQVYVEAGDGSELVSATLSFEKLHRWQSVFPWREWRTGRQLEQSKLIADEFTKLANP